MATSEVKTSDPGVDPATGEYRVLGQGQTFTSVTEKISRIVLTPHKKPPYEAKIVEDPITGFPVLYAGPDAPVLTSEQVAEILADFP